MRKRTYKTALRRARESARLTQQQLADLVGVSRDSVCGTERRGIRTTTAAKRYAAALNIGNPQKLLEW
jgi:DNA-binding XRE family transcriptional regulator